MSYPVMIIRYLDADTGTEIKVVQSNNGLPTVGCKYKMDGTDVIVVKVKDDVYRRDVWVAKASLCHFLKTVQPYFGMIAEGSKTFELRKEDRGFEIGDYLILQEYQKVGEMSRPTPVKTYERYEDLGSTKGGYTGEVICKRVGSVIYGEFGLEPGYCAMSLLEIG